MNQAVWTDSKFWIVFIIVAGIVLVTFIFRGSKLKKIGINGAGINANKEFG